MEDRLIKNIFGLQRRAQEVRGSIDLLKRYYVSASPIYFPLHKIFAFSDRISLFRTSLHPEKSVQNFFFECGTPISYREGRLETQLQ